MSHVCLEMQEGGSRGVDVDEPTEADDIIVIVESKKATNKIEPREDGIVREILASSGRVVEPGDPMEVFGGANKDISDIVDKAKSMSDMSSDSSAAESGGELAKTPQTDDSTVSSDRMSTSHQQAPHVTLNRSFDATTLLDVGTAAAAEDIEILVTDSLIRGVGKELADRPAFNAPFEDKS